MSVEHWFGIGVAILWCYLFWPDLKPVFGIAPSVVTNVSVGTVQQVHFIDGGIGYDTQVDTQVRSFLLSGIAGLDRGTPVDLRTQDGRNALCVSASDACWRVMGRQMDPIQERHAQ